MRSVEMLHLLKLMFKKRLHDFIPFDNLFKFIRKPERIHRTFANTLIMLTKKNYIR